MEDAGTFWRKLRSNEWRWRWRWIHSDISTICIGRTFESHQIDAPISSLVLQEHIEDASTCTALHNLAEMEAHHVREPGFPRDLPGDVEGGSRARMEEEAGVRVVLDACAIHSLRSDVRLQWRRVEHRSSGRGEPCSVQAEGVIGRSYGRASHIHPVHALKSCGG